MPMYSADPVMQSKCEKLVAIGGQAGLDPGTIADLVKKLLENGPQLLAFFEQIIAIFKQS